MRSIVFLALLVGCEAPIDPNDRWLVVETSGPYEGAVTFSDGHVMESSGTGGSAFPLLAGESVCWTFERIETGPGFLRVFVGDRTGRKREGLTSTTEPSGRVEGCA